MAVGRVEKKMVAAGKGCARVWQYNSRVNRLSSISHVPPNFDPNIQIQPPPHNSVFSLTPKLTL